MTKRTTVSVIILAVAISFGLAAAGDKEQGEGRGFFMVGMHTIDVADLSAAVTNQGYGELDNRFFSMGGCGFGIIKDRLVIGGEGHGLAGDNHSADGYDVALMGGYGMFNIGFVAMKKGTFHLYPLLGIGGGGFTLKIVQSSGAAFDEMLKDPNRGMELNTGGLILSLALGGDYLVNLSQDADEIGGVAFGFRLGYNFTPLIGDWMFEEHKISGGPEIGITGPFVKIMIGGGGKGKR